MTSTSRGLGFITDVNEAEVTIVTNKSTCPLLVGAVTAEFGKVLKIPGRVRFVHPFQNLSVVVVERTRLGDFPLPKQQLQWSNQTPKLATKATLVGLSKDHDLVTNEIVMSSYITPDGKADSKRRAKNNLGLIMKDPVRNMASGGIVFSASKEVVGILSPSQTVNTKLTIPTYVIPGFDYITPLFPRKHASTVNLPHCFQIPYLEVELKAISLSEAENYGVSVEWIKKLKEASKHGTTGKMQCLKVERRTQL